jgi:hypothetical protein
MKRNYLFILLITGTLTVSIMAGQRIGDAKKNESTWPFKDFVSRCRDHKLSERLNEYRAQMDALIKQGRYRPLKGCYREDGYFFDCRHDDGFLFDLIYQIAKQGDFEGLELLEKDIPSPPWKYEFWEAVTDNDTMDGARKLLVKWAIENPAVIILMKYHPNGLNLLIEMAEDKNTDHNRAVCLEILASMPDATKVLDRIKALISDKSGIFIVNEPRWDTGISYPKTVGDIAARAVEILEAAKKQQEK